MKPVAPPEALHDWLGHSVDIRYRTAFHLVPSSASVELTRPAFRRAIALARRSARPRREARGWDCAAGGSVGFSAGRASPFRLAARHRISPAEASAARRGPSEPPISVGARPPSMGWAEATVSADWRMIRVGLGASHREARPPIPESNAPRPACPPPPTAATSRPPRTSPTSGCSRRRAAREPPRAQALCTCARRSRSAMSTPPGPPGARSGYPLCRRARPSRACRSAGRRAVDLLEMGWPTGQVPRSHGLGQRHDVRAQTKSRAELWPCARSRDDLVAIRITRAAQHGWPSRSTWRRHDPAPAPHTGSR